MTADLLSILGKTSLSAAVMILAAFVLRLRFQDKTPRRVFCLLWDLILVRLLVMAELPSPVSIRRFLPVLARQTADVSEPSAVSVLAEDAQTVQGLFFTGTAVETGTLCRDTVFSLPPMPWNTVLTVLWLVGALVLAVWLLWGHLRSRRIYAASLPVRDVFVLDWLAAHPLRRPVQARSSDRIASPLTCGILYPAVLLPSRMDWQDQDALSWVLAHEHTHIKRFDTLRKGLLAAALCLHWFNPLVWAMYVLANRDIELACDEAVLWDREDRKSYALALLGMEERRGRWTASGSYFSQNALEERIQAIMKHKHFSVTALVAILVVMCLATTVFAAAPEETKQNPPVTSCVEPVEEDNCVIMMNGETGEKLYSIDNGATWLEEECYQAQYGSWGDGWDVEWWTYEEYKDWLEREKADLQEIIGSRGWTPSTGWFTWDQQKVDETIALYEDTLEKIKNGALYSKRIIDKNGNEVEDVMLGSDGPLVITSTFDNDQLITEKPVDAAKILEELRSFGVAGDEKALTYNGQLIRYLVDGVSFGDGGFSIQYLYTNENGTADVHTLRSVIYNPDGSFDPMGDLIGLVTKGDMGFDQELIDAAAFSGGPQVATAQAVAEDMGTGEQGRTFEEIFAKFAPYGLIYLPRESGMGALSLNGQPVKSFADLMPDGGSFSYQDPYAESGLKVLTVYDADGNLTGLDIQEA